MKKVKLKLYLWKVSSQVNFIVATLLVVVRRRMCRLHCTGTYTGAGQPEVHGTWYWFICNLICTSGLKYLLHESLQCADKFWQYLHSYDTRLYCQSLGSHLKPHPDQAILILGNLDILFFAINDKVFYWLI